MATETIGPDDATSTIIQDCWIGSAVPAYNYGSDAYIYTQASGVRKALIRIADATDIPSGTITEVRLKLKCRDDNPAITWYRVADAADWVEGRGSGSPLTGETTWNLLKHGSPGTSWPGSAGCSTSGTDYVATSVGTLAAGPGGTSYNWRTVTITASVAEHWRDTSNQGLVAIGGSYLRMQSSEAALADRPYFEIDYDSGAPHYYNMLNKGRR